MGLGLALVLALVTLPVLPLLLLAELSVVLL